MRKVSVTDQVPPVEPMPKQTDSNSKRLEEELKLLKIELSHRDNRPQPQSVTHIVKKMLRSLHMAKVVTEHLQKREEEK